MQKNEDLVAFTIPCTNGLLHFTKTLFDLGAQIISSSGMQLLMVDRKVKSRTGILHDVLEMVESFIFLADFVILDYEVDFEVPIILGRSLLAKDRALVYMEKGQMKF